jgi:mRNA (guanine-N7-)-methyltransferase
MKQEEFYDRQQETVNKEARTHSETVFVKKFNNFIKTLLINLYCRKLGSGLSVLDLCCGRGGDLGKWAKQNINHYVGVDLSGPLVEEAKNRYRETYVDRR